MKNQRNKKKIQKEINANNQAIHIILQNNIATKEEYIKLHILTRRNKELRSLLHSNRTSSQNNFHYETPKHELLEIEKKYDLIHGKSEEYCENCGTPNGKNIMNGKLWCFKCNKPLKITFKKPQTTWKPQLKVNVSKEEQEQFYLKQVSILHSQKF